MKKNLYISIVALSIAMFTSCKKEEMFAPQAPESSSSFKTTETEKPYTGPNTSTGDEDSNGIIVGSDTNDKNGSGTSRPSRIIVGSDTNDKNGSGTSRGKKIQKADTSPTGGGSTGGNNVPTIGGQK